MAGEYKIKVNNPARPKGDPIEVFPFGLVPNGDSFTAFLTKSEVGRYEGNVHLDVTESKRKKSDMSEDHAAQLETAQAAEEDQENARKAAQEAMAGAAVAGEESIAQTEPVEGPAEGGEQ